MMQKKEQNLMIYAPKDDQYHREKWREKYPQEKAEFLKRISTNAIERSVQFSFCISPGKDFRFRNEEDYQILADKYCWAIYYLGSRVLSLFMDDIARDITVKKKI